MKFVNHARYAADAGKIAATRPAHRDYLGTLLASGQLLLAGPFTDDSGALFVYEAETLEAARALVAADPFAQAGVFEHCDIKPWKLVFSAPTELVPAG
ncbi:MAG: hypothetical protein HY749_08870 [Gammaproteobacteria bacterium]|nr:hypothetical protein [Gammaproteobacteria bacterium]MBI5616815.1 hypothetical protein [Gammaproteobacteria bacterium]